MNRKRRDLYSPCYHWNISDISEIHYKIFSVSLNVLSVTDWMVWEEWVMV